MNSNTLKTIIALGAFVIVIRLLGEYTDALNMLGLQKQGIFPGESQPLPEENPNSNSSGFQQPSQENIDTDSTSFVPMGGDGSF